MTFPFPSRAVPRRTARRPDGHTPPVDGRDRRHGRRHLAAWTTPGTTVRTLNSPARHSPQRVAEKRETSVANTKPISGAAGTVELDGVSWTLKLGRHKITGRLERWPFEVEAIGTTSCRVNIHRASDPDVAISFDLPDTSAAALEADLEARGCGYRVLLDEAQDRKAEKQLGAWWVDLAPGLMLVGCHWTGSKSKGESGDLRATAAGLEYRALLGSKVRIAWAAILTDEGFAAQKAKRLA